MEHNKNKIDKHKFTALAGVAGAAALTGLFLHAPASTDVLRVQEPSEPLPSVSPIVEADPIVVKDISEPPRIEASSPTSITKPAEVQIVVRANPSEAQPKAREDPEEVLRPSGTEASIMPDSSTIPTREEAYAPVEDHGMNPVGVQSDTPTATIGG